MTAGLLAQGLTAMLCLGVVLLLIVGSARVVRAVPALRAPTLGTAGMALRGSLALDRQRRLHIVEVDGRQMLILTGGGADAIIPLPPS